jgi:hypothetical protein
MYLPAAEYNGLKILHLSHYNALAYLSNLTSTALAK